MALLGSRTRTVGILEPHLHSNAMRMALNLHRGLGKMRAAHLSRSPSSSASARLSTAIGATKSSIRSIQQDIREKKRSVEEIVSHHLDTIASKEPLLNSFITVDGEQALKQVGRTECQ